VALPPAAASLDEAFAAIELWEFYKGRKLDEGQRLDVCVMLATRDDGLWAASVTGHEKPRQSGKGDSVEVVELWGLTQRAERILHTIHDAVLLATETQSRMLSLLDGHPDLRRLKNREWKGTGQQMIEMRNGGMVWYRTRTGAGGRGVDEVDRLIVDEAQHAELQHLAAITPTQAVAANPQLNALGTGALEGKSSWWWSLRKQAKQHAGSLGWVGWSAQRWTVNAKGHVDLDDVDPFDRDLWWATIPGLVAGRTSIEFLERELQVLGPLGFAQEYLCVWADPDDGGTSHLIPADVWSNCAMPGSSIVSHDQWSLTISPDRKWASFGIAGRTADGKIHVESIDRRGGTDWVIGRAVEIWQAKKIPVRIHKTGPEGSLIARLKELGVEVVEVSSAEVAQATGQFIDDANAGTIVHLNQPVLNKALDGAELKTGSDGAAIWSQRNSSVEITPLMACTVALGGVPQELAYSGPAFIDLDDFDDDE
jgi:hypothetical protein